MYHVIGYYNVAGRFPTTVCLIPFLMSQIAAIVSSRKLLLSAVSVTVFLLAEKLRSASAFPCGNAKQAFTTLAIFQIAHCISSAQHVAPHLVNS